uniref:Uncharacterized protein n=1 Tax=Arundo donax TaxID=35708 RepID=A0A0A9EU62_ARUDO
MTPRRRRWRWPHGGDGAWRRTMRRGSAG